MTRRKIVEFCTVLATLVIGSTVFAQVGEGRKIELFNRDEDGFFEATGLGDKLEHTNELGKVRAFSTWLLGSQRVVVVRLLSLEYRYVSTSQPEVDHETSVLKSDGEGEGKSIHLVVLRVPSHDGSASIAIRGVFLISESSAEKPKLRIIERNFSLIESKWTEETASRKKP